MQDDVAVGSSEGAWPGTNNGGASDDGFGFDTAECFEDLEPCHKCVILRCAEAGVLYLRVKRDCEFCFKSRFAVPKSFSQSVQLELSNYYALIATLESTLATPSPLPPSYSKLTALLLHTSIHLPVSNLSTLACLTHTVCGGCNFSNAGAPLNITIGGQLASVIYKWTDHGDGYRRTVVQGIIEGASKPIYTMIYR